MDDLLDVIVVGYGLAGRIHAKTHRNLVGSCRLAGIVECSLELHPVIAQQFAGVQIFETLEQALTSIKGNVVLDLCVPAPQNIELVKAAVAFGVKRVMLEKPLAWSLPMAMTLAEILCDQEAVYLDTYQFSFGVEQLKNWVVREQCGIERIQIKFNKNRTAESCNGRGFDNDTAPDAWHIEGPHMVTIAMKIAGEILAIEEASLHDMAHEGDVHSNHGGAKAIVKHHNGVLTSLITDLCSDENERLVEVFLKNKVCLRLLLPASKSTRLISRLEKIDHGRIVDSYVIEDCPMEQCVSSSIDYFLTKNRHAQLLDHGVRINQILQKLTEASGSGGAESLQTDEGRILL
jgi:predicted dehydrogenase